MASNQFRKFRQAQRERGPYAREPRRNVKRATGFPIFVMAAAALMFLAVFFGDHVTRALGSAVQLSRNLGRGHSPTAGAYYSNCDDARSEGVAPLYRGEPGYRPEMDADSDGIACEPYRG